MSADIAALILAGGRAVRMGGGDKPLLDIGGISMLARILETLRADHARIAISANGDPARFAAFGVPVLPDGAQAGQGPLAGVLAGLDWAAAQGRTALLTVPGDTPFIPAGLAAMLSPPPACAANENGTHHLVALWPVAARRALRDWLDTAASRRVADFAARLGMRQVRIAMAGDDPFLNVNTPEDLAAARRHAPERRPR